MPKDFFAWCAAKCRISAFRPTRCCHGDTAPRKLCLLSMNDVNEEQAIRSVCSVLACLLLAPTALAQEVAWPRRPLARYAAPLPVSGAGPVERGLNSSGGILPVRTLFPVERREGAITSIDVRQSRVEPAIRESAPSLAGVVLRATSATGVRLPAADLARLATLVSDEYQGRTSLPPNALDMIRAFRGEVPTDAVNRQLLSTAGMDVKTFKTTVERVEIVYPFEQLYRETPIEYQMLVARRYDGESISSVRGKLLDPRFIQVVNRRTLTVQAAQAGGLRSLRSLEGVNAATLLPLPGTGRLVLLPYERARPGGPVLLRYVWRVHFLATTQGHSIPIRAWVDAETGNILLAEPLVVAAAGAGDAWKRDPGQGQIVHRTFEIDDSSQAYTLTFKPMGPQLDYRRDGIDSHEVSVGQGRLGADGVVDFTVRGPLPSAAVCDGGNPLFEQVHLFATISAFRGYALGLGMFTPFPIETRWQISTSAPSASCSSSSDMHFDTCLGFSDPQCPESSDPTGQYKRSYLSMSSDNSIIAHEIGHNITKRLSEDRPEDWCGSSDCLRVHGFGLLHDIADAWADHMVDSNCTGGWTAKNAGGIDASLNCKGSRGHDEGYGLPRLHELPTDSFPEHRRFNQPGDAGGADMQIAAAALWAVRQGVRGLEPTAGHVLYGVRLAAALRKASVSDYDESSDWGVYARLEELAVYLLEEWAGSPRGKYLPEAAYNKVAAGFARAGIFGISAVCIDGEPATSDESCPSADSGADAVIDIDDQDTTNDPVYDGVTHRQVDYLRLGGPAPTFQAWTGPRYWFQNGKATLKRIAPCNAAVLFEVSNEPDFTSAATISSGWLEVAVDATLDDACTLSWSPDPSAWSSLQSSGIGSRLYYRAKTRDSSQGSLRTSTSPLAGRWQVPPSSAILTVDGTSNL